MSFKSDKTINNSYEILNSIFERSNLDWIIDNQPIAAARSLPSKNKAFPFFVRIINLRPYNHKTNVPKIPLTALGANWHRSVDFAWYRFINNIENSEVSVIVRNSPIYCAKRDEFECSLCGLAGSRPCPNQVSHSPTACFVSEPLLRLESLMAYRKKIVTKNQTIQCERGIRDFVEPIPKEFIPDFKGRVTYL